MFGNRVLPVELSSRIGSLSHTHWFSVCLITLVSQRESLKYQGPRMLIGRLVSQNEWVL